MTVLDVPLARISQEARRIQVGRLLLTVLAGVLYSLGWGTRKTVGGLWFAVTWCVAAVKVGWIEAGRDGAS